MNPELVEGLFVRDDDEGLFSRGIDGQLVRLDSPTKRANSSRSFTLRSSYCSPALTTNVFPSSFRQ